MPKLYLHAGTHKTGTTALQQFGHKNRKQLLNRGIFYADYGEDTLPLRDGHHQFAHELATGEADSLIRLSDIVEHWRNVAEAYGVPVLFSAEALWRHKWPDADTHWEGRAEYMQRLADLLAKFDVEPIIVYRRPDDFARSVYQEAVATGLKQLPEFREWITRANSMFEYTRNTTVICDPFSSGHHWVYEHLVQEGGLHANFFANLGVDIEGLERPKAVRESLSPAETVIKNYANQFIGKRPEGREFLKWMRDNDVASRIEGESSRGFNLWSSAQERLDFLESRKDDVAQLHRKFFTHYRGDSLFPSPDPDEIYDTPELSSDVVTMVRGYFSAQ